MGSYKVCDNKLCPWNIVFDRNTGLTKMQVNRCNMYHDINKCDKVAVLEVKDAS